ncbi:MAG: hypothetical protein HFE68_04125 [Erysipelotrichaceae bacterium]|nr:hypothetical protein [Erysipelotrichaceae bacterium]
MTRNQHYAIKIMLLLENGMDASVEYNAYRDDLDYYHGYKDQISSISIYNSNSDEEAREVFNAIVKEIKSMKGQKEDNQT